MDSWRSVGWALFALFEGGLCVLIVWLVCRVARHRRERAAMITALTDNAAIAWADVPPLKVPGTPEEEATRKAALKRASEATTAAADAERAQTLRKSFKTMSLAERASVVLVLGPLLFLAAVCLFEALIHPLATLQGVVHGASRGLAYGTPVLLLVVAALFLVVAYLTLRISLSITVATRGLALIPPLLIWAAFAAGWTPLGWVLVGGTGVLLGGFIVLALAG